MSEPDGLIDVLRGTYRVEVEATVQMKTVTGIVASDGMRYIWKAARLRDTEQRLSIVARVVEAMCDAGYPAAGPLPTCAGAWVHTLPDGRTGYLQPWLPGAHLDLADRVQRLTAVSTIAQVHRWSQGVDFLRDRSIGGPEWQHLSGGPLPVKLQSKLRVLQRAWGTACDACRDLRQMEGAVFDVAQVVVDWARLRSVAAQARDATDEESESSPDAPSQGRTSTASGEEVAALCHRDLAPHNMLWHAAAWPVSLIDFDHAGWDDPLLDLMQLSNHTFYVCDPGAGHFLDVVDVYRRSAPLSADREAFLWQLLRFPDVLIRTVMEWVKAGCPAAGRVKVTEALEKERLRWRLWAADMRARWG